MPCGSFLNIVRAVIGQAIIEPIRSTHANIILLLFIKSFFLIVGEWRGEGRSYFGVLFENYFAVSKDASVCTRTSSYQPATASYQEMLNGLNGMAEGSRMALSTFTLIVVVSFPERYGFGVSTINSGNVAILVNQLIHWVGPICTPLTAR